MADDIVHRMPYLTDAEGVVIDRTECCGQSSRGLTLTPYDRYVTCPGAGHDESVIDKSAVVQDRLNRVITALFIERSGEENSVRWGGPRIADLVSDDERWMMDLLRDGVNASADVFTDMVMHGRSHVAIEGS